MLGKARTLFTVLGILIVMLIDSPLLALVALVTVPISMLITAKIGKRSALQSAVGARGAARHAQIEEPSPGMRWFAYLARQKQVQVRFDAKNVELYEASFRANSVQRDHADHRLRRD